MISWLECTVVLYNLCLIVIAAFLSVKYVSMEMRLFLSVALLLLELDIVSYEILVTEIIYGVTQVF